MKSINTRTREAFYWLAILFTFALGTAGGDVFLDDLGLPLAVTFAGFTAALALVWLAYKRNWLSPVTSFWIAYVLTRPLGAALGDGLAQPTADTGLGLGPTLVSGVFLVAILGLVAYLTISKRDRLES
jgi:uncharacterized membrane-anchored protein